MLKIGVLGCFYGCAELLPQILEPWARLVNRGDAPEASMGLTGNTPPMHTGSSEGNLPDAAQNSSSPRYTTGWAELKEEGHDIVLAAVNAQFKEYAELGFANDDGGTRADLPQETARVSSPDIVAAQRFVREDVLDLLQGIHLVAVEYPYQVRFLLKQFPERNIARLVLRKRFLHDIQ